VTTGERGRADGLSAAAIFVGTLVVFLPFAPLGVDPHHDGIVLKPALDIASGLTIFKDTFSQYGALATLFQAFLLKVFGPQLLVLKQSVVVAYAISAAALFLCWREVLPRSLAQLSWVLWICFAPFYERYWAMLAWSSVYALALQSLALLCALRAIRTTSLRRARLLEMVAGFCASLIFWTRQPVGILLIAALLALSVARAVARWSGRDPVAAKSPAFRSPLWTLLGLVLGSLPLLAYITAQGIWPEWYDQNIVWPRKLAGTQMSLLNVAWKMLPAPREACILVALTVVLVLPFARLPAWIDRQRARLFPWMLAVSGVTAVSFLVWSLRERRMLLQMTHGWAVALPLAVTILTIVVLREMLARKASALTWSLLALGAISLASWAQYFPVACIRHVFWAASPMFGVAVYAVYRWVRCDARVVAALLVLFLVPIVRDRAATAWSRLDQGSREFVAIASPSWLAGMRADPEFVRAMREIDAALGSYYARDGVRPVYYEGPDALYTLFSPDHRNPGPFYVTWSVWGTVLRADDRARETFIRTTRPVIVIPRSQPSSTAVGLITELGYEKLPLPELAVKFDVFVQRTDAGTATGTPKPHEPSS
jgi:hypothetical protein